MTFGGFSVPKNKRTANGTLPPVPELPDEDFLGSIEAVIRADQDWVPDPAGGEASLYLRPFMFASEAFLGVRPAKQYKFLVISSAAGNYFKSGAPAVSIWVSGDYTRAAPGGTGAAKCGGNYAASLRAQADIEINPKSLETPQ